jgi:hypothetical protein
MKRDDVPVSKFREDMVRKWQNIDEESGNPLDQQYLIPVDGGAYLGSTVMMSLFHRQHQFPSNTKMQLVHNLNNMGDILTMDLN